MNCRETQQLLAFADRKATELDPVERDALKAHLEKCPDCADLVQMERGDHKALTVAMLDVPVPADLKQKVLKRLSAERSVVPWRTSLAAAAVLLIAVSGGVWYLQPPPQVKMADVQPIYNVVHRVPQQAGNWSNDEAKEYLASQGVAEGIPAEFNPECLQNVEVISFKGKPVAKLTYVKRNEAAAIVLILPWKQFRTTELTEDPTALKIQRDEENKRTYLILFVNNLNLLHRQLNN